MDIYQDAILDHARRPRNAGKLARPTHRGKAQNPLCGDTMELFLDVKGGALADIKFEADGCILSRAAMSIVSEKIKGKKIVVIAKLGAPDVFKLLGFAPTPSRAKCATFGFETIRILLDPGSRG